MLQNYQQFVNSQAVKNQASLFSPRVVKSEDVLLPRESVYHYLDTSSEEMFPSRTSPYLANVPKNKKIPILNVKDLLAKEETISIKNRTVDKTIRDWAKSHIHQFRLQELLTIPNADNQTNAVVNYNLLNDLYKYASTATSKNSHRKNIYKTYWTTVHEAIKVSKNDTHFVSISIPNNIPSANYLRNISKLRPSIYSRVVTNDSLFGILTLFNFLETETRAQSVMSDISDEDTTQIMMELKFNGYSCFFKLSDLISLSSQSKLPSKRKILPQQLQKLLVIILFSIQKKITGLVEKGVEVVPEETETPSVIEKASEEEEDPEADEFAGNQTPFKPPELVSMVTKLPPPVAPEMKPLETLEELTSVELDKFIDNSTAGLSDLELADYPDEVYEEPQVQASDKDHEPAQPTFPEPNYDEQFKTAILADTPVSIKFNNFLEKAKKSESLSSVEIRALKKIHEKRAELKSPYEQNQLLDLSANITPEDTRLDEEELEIKSATNLVKDSLKKEVLFNFDKQYINKLMKKDILACVKSLESSGLIIKDYSVDVDRSSLGAFEIHKLVLKPYRGKESPVYFRIPVINKEGEFTASSIHYRMKKTRQDLPLRKVSPIRVAITSNYSKLFITRTERVAYDPFNYITKYIKESYLDEQGIVKKVEPGYSFENTEQSPNIFAYMSKELKGFSTDDYTFQFNKKDFTKNVKQEVLDAIGKRLDYQLLTYCGYINSNKHILVVDKTNTIYDYTDDMKPLGTLDQLLQIDPAKLPKPFSNIKILGDDIPLGVVMSYYLGLSNLLGVTNTKYKTLPANKQYKPEKDELVLKFEDLKLILLLDTESKRLLFNGFSFYREFLKTVPAASLQSQDIYLDLIQFRGNNLMHLKEMDMLRDMFLDPITKDVLCSMREPVDYLELLLRANSMLDDFSHPDINDPSYSRIRGYDRVPGLMYRALTESVRAAKFRGNGRGKIELDPYKVWNYVTQDNTVKITEDANPISDVKEVEAVTFAGLDGISKNATPESIRRFHKNDRNLAAEATVDSSDVGLNFYLTPYARLKDLRGVVAEQDNQHLKDNPEKVFSTSALLAPFVEMDDPKRVNFVSIQNGHTIVAAGYQQPILRTGYEYLMPYKVGKLYCVIASEPGVVLSVTDKKIVLQYKSGKKESFQLGETYGRMEGSVYKHVIVTELKAGDKFKKEDYITYNTGYFEKDWLNPDRLILKFSKLASVAFVMNDEVYEDSSAISARLSEEMSTPYVKEKIFLIDFSKNIIGLREEGSMIEPNDILFTLVDGNTDYSNLSDSSIELLKNVAALSPKAKMKGKIFKYEIKYNGEYSDMSLSIRKLVTALDKDIAERTLDSEEPVTDNSATSEYRSEGKNLMANTLELRVFIETNVSLAVGDKGVVGGQMKSVVSDVFQSNVTTESGVPVDIMFSYRSVLNRTVLSPIIGGTTIRLAVHISPIIAEQYFS